MSADTSADKISWPTSPVGYEWKGTISQAADSWVCLAHCPEVGVDCVIKVKRVEDPLEADLVKVVKDASQLVSMTCEQLLKPVCVFVESNEVWAVYPRVNGGPIGEVLRSHFHHGIEDEKIVARMLADTIAGVRYLHNIQIVHRNIRADSLHLAKDSGQILLWEFQDLKEIKYKDATRRQNTMVGISKRAWTDPLIILGKHISWFKGDVYSLGMTALELAFGAVPDPKPLSFTPESIRSMEEGLTADTAFPDRTNPFGEDFNDFVKRCTVSVDSRVSLSDLAKHPFLKKACSATHMATTVSKVCKSTESRINSKLTAPMSFPNVSKVGVMTSSLSLSGSGMSPMSSGASDEDTSDSGGDHVHLSVTSSTVRRTRKTSKGRTFVTETLGSGGDALEMTDELPPSSVTLKSQSSDWDFTTATTPIIEDELAKAKAEKAVSQVVDEGTPLAGVRGSSSASEETDEEMKDGRRGKSTKIGRFDVEESTAEGTLKSDHHSLSHSQSDDYRSGAQATSSLGLASTHIGGSGGRGSLSLSEDSRFGIVTTPATPAGIQSVAPPLGSAHSRQQSDSYSMSITTPAGQVGRFEVMRVSVEPTVESPSDHPTEPETEISVSDSARSDDDDTPPPQTVGRFFVEMLQPGEVAKDLQSHATSSEDGSRPSATEASSGAASLTAIAESSSVTETAKPRLDESRAPDWDVKEVALWLATLGDAYVIYQGAFESNGVDGSMLKDLDGETLEELGVKKKIHRMKILKTRDKLFS